MADPRSDLAEDADRTTAVQWVVENFLRMFDVLNEPLRAQAKVTRQGYAMLQDSTESAQHDSGGRGSFDSGSTLR